MPAAPVEQVWPPTKIQGFENGGKLSMLEEAAAQCANWHSPGLPTAEEEGGGGRRVKVPAFTWIFTHTHTEAHTIIPLN